MVVCRVNPVTNEAWTVVSAMPVNGGSNARPGGGTSESTTPIREQAKIKSLTYSLANPAKPGDLLTEMCIRDRLNTTKTTGYNLMC